MQRIFLLRHGQTDYNLQNKVQGGGIDSVLNAVGFDQARRFHTAYYDFPFRHFLHTALQRTKQTIGGFESDGRELIAYPEFNEMNWGILEGAEADDFVQKEFKRMNEGWAAGDLNLRVKNGESPREVWERSRQGWERMLREHPEGDILLCTHGRTLRVMLAGLLGYGLQNMNLFGHENTGLNVLVRTGANRLFAEKLNDVSHLN